jgi:ribonucleoside-diphosphate reductase beta chain
MSLIFSQTWAEELGAALNGSETYRRAARRWEGSLLLASAEQEADAVFLDLDAGVCRAARRARAGDDAHARFVLSASHAVWRRVLDGKVGAIPALLKRQIKLERGRLTELMPHAAAARELVVAAQGLGTEFPRTEDPSERRGPADAAAEPALAADRRFVSLSVGGLAYETPPMVLWRKAKQRGVWNPEEIDLRRDRADWLQLAVDERRLLLQLATLFGAGEESVALDLLPLLQVVASEGRLEEEMYLTSFLWEEAKHVEAFRRFFDGVAEVEEDLDHLLTASHRRIFADELPTAMGRLRHDSSAIAVAEASTTYNMIVEGVLAETGYHTYHRILRERRILPGMQEMVGHLQADESRHLAYGVFLLSRLVAEHGEPVWLAIERRMEHLLEPALGIVEEVFAQYEPQVPFGLEIDHFMGFAVGQFERRRRRIERARRQSLSDVLRQPIEVLES